MKLLAPTLCLLLSPSVFPGNRVRDLHDISIDAAHVQKESLASLQRCQQYAEESLDAGAQSISMLRRQEEQVRSTQAHSDSTSANLTAAERTLNKMSSILPFLRRRKVTLPHASSAHSNPSRSTPQASPAPSPSARRRTGKPAAATSCTASLLQEDPLEKEINEGLEGLSREVAALNHMAMVLSKQLDDSLTQIDELNASADHAQLQLERTQRKTTKALNK